VVWDDERNWSTSKSDIYGYNLSSASEFSICTDSSYQRAPAVFKDIVVWNDSRSGNWDIYGYNLSSSTEFPVCTNSAGQYYPAISGDAIVWHDWRNGNYDIYGATLHCQASSPTPTPTATPTATMTATATATATSTALYGDATGEGDVDVADYARLKGVMLLSASCNPGADANMDGCIDIADYARLKALILAVLEAHGMYVSGYDFSSGAGTAHLARYKQVTTMPTDIFPNDTGWSSFTTTNYTEVEALDALNFSMPGSAAKYNAVQCRFTVSGGINLSTVTDLSVTLVGFSENTSETLQFWAWNFDTSNWQQVVGDIAMSNGECSYTQHTVCDCWGKVYDSYVNGSGLMYLMIILADSNRSLSIDYIQVVFVGPEM
jgi:beta propeller repeat protein